MQTRLPLILTARIEEEDLAYFNELRKRHFPPDGNFLSAHLTMFHRLPGEYKDRIITILESAVRDHIPLEATVSNIRHLGAGVAYSIENAALAQLRALLREKFAPWLGPHDKQGWRPHITVQNKVAKSSADRLYENLAKEFQPRDITITGVDLWRYLSGPWQHERYVPFEPRR